MEENNKYYTPTIEEFHVGFEYELLTLKGDWLKSIIDTQSIFTVLRYYSTNTRVKYLDQEDIESLGWNYTGRGVDLWFSKEGIFFAVSGGHKFTEYKLQYGLHDNRLKIEAFFGGESEGILFEGIIKNKSELKRLMKQLGIYE